MKVKIIRESEGGTGSLETEDADYPGAFRNGLIQGFISGSTMEGMHIEIDGQRYEVPDRQVTVGEFIEHLEHCVELHKAFYESSSK